MTTLVINAGSSSLKFSLFEGTSEARSATGIVDWGGSAVSASCRLTVGDATQAFDIDAVDHLSATGAALRSLESVGALRLTGQVTVGHRVVHGGTTLRDSTRIDADVIHQIGELSSVAPLHNPPALESIRAAQRLLPGAAHVAVFDTAFYKDLPPHRYVYPLPYDWFERWGIRRFGFHGISHAYAVARAAEFLDCRLDDLNIITCHLGAGCSVTASRGGGAVATSMGFTPLAGPMMGTRSGSIDPGILTYVQRTHGIEAGALDDILNRESGLLGVSGVSSDYRAVEASAAAGNERAQLALDIYADDVRRVIGASATALDRLDALIFTAGIGENSAGLRASVCDGLATLGIQLDAMRNRAIQPDADVAAADSSARVLVLRAREDLMIARETRRVVGA